MFATLLNIYVAPSSVQTSVVHVLTSGFSHRPFNSVLAPSVLKISESPGGVSE